MMNAGVRSRLFEGCAIPAHPLALTAERKLDERRQRALSRYYLDAGAGGLAVGVHTTQFAVRDPKIGLHRPVLELARAAMDEHESKHPNHPAIRVAGICGATPQAVSEAETARELGYQIGLLSLGALRDASIPELIDHARAVAETIPIMGFYLQPSVGGRVLPYEFWRAFCDISNVCSIKIAPFNRYQTLDVVRAVADSDRADEIALYTGNDDTIVCDLLSEFYFQTPRGPKTIRFAGGLLGHWAVWTKKAVEMLGRIKGLHRNKQDIPFSMTTLAAEVTDCNAAFFDPANGFAGCIAGVHEVLRRQGLMQGRWCLDPNEDLSPGQDEEITRVYRTYPRLNDDDFVRENLDRWLAD